MRSNVFSLLFGSLAIAFVTLLMGNKVFSGGDPAVQVAYLKQQMSCAKITNDEDAYLQAREAYNQLAYRLDISQVTETFDPVHGYISTYDKQQLDC
jgi:hypothetical protein